MAVRLKKLNEQVIVLTGASSGIGLATARMAARRGARLVLAARNAPALEQLAREIQAGGSDALAVPADVGHEDDVKRVARAAAERFGGFDTWVNDAGVGIYGNMLDVPVADQRKLFETNFWGVVYGSLEAARHLKGRGGAIVNVGSEVSDRSIPIQGMYATSKHAVKGFTDALRMELEMAGAPVSVSLVKPSAIATPFPEHAANYMDREPSLPQPLYAPEVAAEAILHCCENPVRDLFAGGAAAKMSAQGFLAPRLTDWMMELFLGKQLKSSRPPNPADDALYRPTTGLQERGADKGPVKEHSKYTAATTNPLLTAAVLAGVGAAAAALIASSSSGGRRG